MSPEARRLSPGRVSDPFNVPAPTPPPRLLFGREALVLNVYTQRIGGGAASPGS